ncbi:MAG: alpha amylase C-terminal domain-containing protein, partial [Aeromicrobium sp.]
SLDWELLDERPHAGMQHLVRDLNLAYQGNRALWENDYEQAGFRWIEAGDKHHNVFSFVRYDSAGHPLVCISNFAGIDHVTYDVGLPWSGSWTPILNTDAGAYGGSDADIGKVIVADDDAHQGCPASATVFLPALGTIWLTPEAASSREVLRP